jgi:phosphoadenylyl-sulfate reductase (thioredoxin)
LNDLKWSLEKIDSRASCSPEFLLRNFDGRRLRDTVYVSSNSYLHAMLPENTFFKTVDLWMTHWNDDLGTVLPQDVAREALSARSRYPHKRLIIQFLQPHGPFIGDVGTGLKTTSSVAFRHGRKNAIKAYIQNLEIVFRYVEILISNLEGITVVTSDHGEALGEKVMGIPVFGHPKRSRMPVLTNVPWLTIWKRRIDLESDDSGPQAEHDRPATPIKSGRAENGPTMDKEDSEFMARYNLASRFTSERTQNCIDQMSPELKALVLLPFEEKVKKSEEVIREALSRFHNPCMAFSGGTDSLVALHLTLQINHGLSVMFVDTLQDFPETYQFVQRVREEWEITNFVTVRKDKDRCEEFAARLGYKSPEFMVEYCNDHKIVPMLDGLKRFGFDAMIAGIRGVEHEERAKESLFSPRHNPEHFRVHPLLFWKREDVMEYVRRNTITCNPLYSKGYTSLGCKICSFVNTDAKAHERAGRSVIREIVMKRLRSLGYN